MLCGLSCGNSAPAAGSAPVSKHVHRHSLTFNQSDGSVANKYAAAQTAFNCSLGCCIWNRLFRLSVRSARRCVRRRRSLRPWQRRGRRAVPARGRLRSSFRRGCKPRIGAFRGACRRQAPFLPRRSWSVRQVPAPAAMAGRSLRRRLPARPETDRRTPGRSRKLRCPRQACPPASASEARPVSVLLPVRSAHPP